MQSVGARRLTAVAVDVALLAFGHDLSIMGLIGIFLLIGIVKKNAIMMTTLGAFMVALPLAFGAGVG